MSQFEDEPEPTPTQMPRVPWCEARLRRSVEQAEWIGCWKLGAGGCLELFGDGTARQKLAGGGDLQGAITWEWIDPRTIRIRRKPPAGDPVIEMKHRVIRFDGRMMWTECAALSGPLAGVQLTAYFFSSPRPKSWQQE